jgi:uroporphyrinogen-III synthase
MVKKVFISRRQTTSSPFYDRMVAAGYEVIAQSLIHFNAMPFSLPTHFDWVFFYSKNAVKYFFEKVSDAEVKHKRLACIGKGTASTLEQLGYTPDFVGSGHPEEVAEDFYAEAPKSIVLFPQAAYSQQSVQKRLAAKVQTISLVVYKNTPIPAFTIPFCEILVFTSPMNVSAYASHYAIKDNQTCIAIGHTTSQALEEYKVKNIVIATAPSEEKMAEAALGRGF